MNTKKTVLKIKMLRQKASKLIGKLSAFGHKGPGFESSHSQLIFKHVSEHWFQALELVFAYPWTYMARKGPLDSLLLWGGC